MSNQLSVTVLFASLFTINVVAGLINMPFWPDKLNVVASIASWGIAAVILFMLLGGLL